MKSKNSILDKTILSLYLYISWPLNNKNTVMTFIFKTFYSIFILYTFHKQLLSSIDLIFTL